MRVYAQWMGFTLAERRAIIEAAATRCQLPVSAVKVGLDELCANTGWRRSHARKTLTAALQPRIVTTASPAWPRRQRDDAERSVLPRRQRHTHRMSTGWLSAVRSRELGRRRRRWHSRHGRAEYWLSRHLGRRWIVPAGPRSFTVRPDRCAHLIAAIWVEAGCADADGNVVHGVPLGPAVLPGISRGGPGCHRRDGDNCCADTDGSDEFHHGSSFLDCIV